MVRAGQLANYQIVRLGLEKVRLVGHDGKIRGEFTVEEALTIAVKEQPKSDLVLLNRDSQPPLCRLFPKQDKVKKKKPQLYELERRFVKKEVRLISGIQENDLQVKVKQMLDFLNKGFLVNVFVTKKLRSKVKEADEEVEANATRTDRMSIKQLGDKIVEMCGEGIVELNPRHESKSKVILVLGRSGHLG